jgi:hypothetical protein
MSAGLHTLLYEYGNRFDPIKNNAEGFVTRIFEAMSEAQSQSPDQVSEVIESRS